MRSSLTTPTVDWEGKGSHLLLNPNWPLKLREQIAERSEEQRRIWPELIWLATSGTTRPSVYKLVGLSRQAFLVSAQAVNRHLEVQSKDLWLCPLPLFHVGGLSIFARSYLVSGVQAFLWPGPWETRGFVQALQDHRVSLTSLVPTQVYDLVKGGCQAPDSLRAVLVGGGALGESLYKRARALGWPLLPSYGMTEAASQVATAELSSLGIERAQANSSLPVFKRLSHMEWELTEQSVLKIKSSSLLTVQLEVDLASSLPPVAQDPKQNSWYQTEDQVKFWSQDRMSFVGRLKQTIKVSGELVNLMRLNLCLEELLLEKESSLKSELAVVARPCSRRGAELVLLSAQSVPSKFDQELFALFNSRVLPYERLSRVEKTDQVLRNPMGKIAVESGA